MHHSRGLWLLRGLVVVLASSIVREVAAELPVRLVVIPRCLELLLLHLLLVKQILQVLLLLGRAHLGRSHHDAWASRVFNWWMIVLIASCTAATCPIEFNGSEQVLQGLVLLVEELQVIGVLGGGRCCHLPVIGSRSRCHVGDAFHRGTCRGLLPRQSLTP